MRYGIVLSLLVSLLQVSVCAYQTGSKVGVSGISLLRAFRSGASRQEVKPLGSGDISLTLSLVEERVRAGRRIGARVRLVNPYISQKVELQAVAVYTTWDGVEHTVYSNVVVLTIDYSIPIRVDVPNLRTVSAVFDGVPVQGEFTLPDDGREHILELELER